MASRVSSQQAIQQISEQVASFWGGSADLSASNNTMVKAETDFQPGHYEGRNIWFGVREFAMAAAMNGIALHGGTRVYGGTFLSSQTIFFQLFVWQRSKTCQQFMS